MNKVVVTGRITKDIVLTKVSNDLVFSRFSIASKSGFKDENGENITNFFTCVAWRGKAETLAKFCKKGQMITLFGRLQNREYDKADGSKSFMTEIMVEEFEFIGSTNKSETLEPVKTDSKQQTLTPIDDDDDLPF